MHEVNPVNSDIRARLYNAAGAPVGPEIIVAATPISESQPAVCMDNLGRFCVSYTRQVAAANRDVVALRFTAAGVVVGGSVVAATARNEYDSSIACDFNGNFVVSYTVDNVGPVANPVNQDIIARRFNNAGVSLGLVLVATSATVDETVSAIARNNTPNNTNFSIAYAINNNDVWLRRYNGGGGLLGIHPVSVTALRETNPAVAMDFNANTVIAFQQFDGVDWNILARKVSVAGAMSPTFVVQNGANQDTDPTVAMDYSQGDFVVAYNSQAGAVNRVMVTEITPAGAIIVHLTAFVPTNTPLSRPSVTINGADRYIIAFTLFNHPADPGFGAWVRIGVL